MTRLSQVQNSKSRRAHRTRTNIRANGNRPRLSVFISNTNIYAQIIDDETHATLASANSLSIESGTMTEKAQKVGIAIAEAGKKAKVTKVIFDRGNKKYHGRVKALAEAAREKGLEF